MGGHSKSKEIFGLVGFVGLWWWMVVEHLSQYDELDGEYCFKKCKLTNLNELFVLNNFTKNFSTY